MKFRNDEVNDTTDEEDMAQALLETYSNYMQRELEGDYLTSVPRTMNFDDVTVAQDLQSIDTSDESGSCSCSALDYKSYVDNIKLHAVGKPAFRMQRCRKPHHDSSGSDSAELRAKMRRRRRIRRTLDREAVRDESNLGDTRSTTGGRNDGVAGFETIGSDPIGAASLPVITNTPRFRSRKSHKDSNSESEDLQMREIATRLLEQGASLRRRSSDRDDWRNMIHADHTQRAATETVGGNNSMRDADYMSNDVPAAIPAAGQVK